MPFQRLDKDQQILQLTIFLYHQLGDQSSYPLDVIQVPEAYHFHRQHDQIQNVYHPNIIFNTEFQNNV